MDASAWQALTNATAWNDPNPPGASTNITANTLSSRHAGLKNFDWCQTHYVELTTIQLCPRPKQSMIRDTGEIQKTARSPVLENVPK